MYLLGWVARLDISYNHFCVVIVYVHTKFKHVYICQLCFIYMCIILGREGTHTFYSFPHAQGKVQGFESINTFSCAYDCTNDLITQLLHHIKRNSNIVYQVTFVNLEPITLYIKNIHIRYFHARELK